MAQKQIQTPSKIAKQHKVEAPKKTQEVRVDVDDALIDDEHPKDTIRGGPIDRNSRDSGR
jgi:hypothetical protein